MWIVQVNGGKFDNDNKDKCIRTDTYDWQKGKVQEIYRSRHWTQLYQKDKIKSDDTNVPFSTFKKSLNF